MKKKRHPGVTRVEFNTLLSKTWHKLVGRVIIRYCPGHYVWDPINKKDIYRQPFFYAWIDYGEHDRPSYLDDYKKTY